jgi:RNA-directed DNA polymerase
VVGNRGPCRTPNRNPTQSAYRSEAEDAIGSRDQPPGKADPFRSRNPEIPEIDWRIAGIAPKALDKFKMQIREMTRRTRRISLQQLIEELTPYIIGWRGYFGFCQTPRVLANLEAWIRRRLRSYLWRQWQNGHNRFNELRRRGVSKFRAAVAAGSPTGFWRMSGHPAVQQALRNHHFDSLGLPRLYVPAQA